MFFDSNAVRLSAVILIVTTIILVIIKPPIFFSSTGHLKSIGFNYSDQETPVTLGLFLYGCLVPVYLIILLTDNQFNIIDK